MKVQAATLFEFDTSAIRDTFTNFNAATETVRLENAVFIPVGATDASERIFYGDTKRAVLRDIDGISGVVAVQFATISGAPMLTMAHFFLI